MLRVHNAGLFDVFFNTPDSPVTFQIAFFLKARTCFDNLLLVVYQPSF